MRRLSLLLAVSFFVVVSDATAMIQIDRGIAGARLGATRDDVRAALGKPTKVAAGTNEFGRWVRYTYDGGLRVFPPGSGLNPGEWVIVNGVQRVRPGIEVKPERVPMPTRPGADARADGGKQTKT